MPAKPESDGFAFASFLPNDTVLLRRAGLPRFLFRRVRGSKCVKKLERVFPSSGNKGLGGSLSQRQILEQRLDPTEAHASEARARFGDQMVALLPRLRRFARGLCGNVAEADDLVQAACERALLRAHQFEEGTRFDSWMFRIVQTIWIDQVRAREIRRRKDAAGEERLGSDEPVRRVEARLALNEVRRAVATLSPDHRAALMLVTVDGLSYKEAAEVARVPIGTIMSRLARARLALQAALDGKAQSRKGDDAG